MLVSVNSNVNGDIDAGGKIEFLELVDRLGRGLNDVDKALVSARLELLHRLLVDVRRTVDRKLLDAGRERDRAGNAGAGALGGFDDLERGLIDDAIVEALEFDANALAFHGGKKNEGLGAGRSLHGAFDDLLEGRIWNLREMRGSDRGRRTTLGERANVGDVTEEEFERDVRRDDARTGLVFHALDLTATTVDVAHEVALILFRS